MQFHGSYPLDVLDNEGLGVYRKYLWGPGASFLFVGERGRIHLECFPGANRQYAHVKPAVREDRTPISCSMG